MDGVDVRIEHGLGQAGVRPARTGFAKRRADGKRGVARDFMDLHPGAQSNQFGRRRGFLRREEQPQLPQPRAEVPPAGEHAQRNGQRHAGEHGREPPEQRQGRPPT